MPNTLIESPESYLQHGPSGVVLAVIVVCFSATMLMIGFVIRSLTTSTKEGVRQLALLNKTGEGMQNELREVRQHATDSLHEVRESRREQTEQTRNMTERLAGIEHGIDYLVRNEFHSRSEHQMDVVVRTDSEASASRDNGRAA